MRKGFTLIELLVAMAVLALMIAFASMVFKVSIDTYRVSTATAEIMQKLRAVTDQLDADFKGLRKDAPLLIWFAQDTANQNARHDQIMSFADGDFSSIQLYNKITNRPDLADGTLVIRGNTARIYYGQANINESMRRRILVRRQHILTEDADTEDWPHDNLSDLGYDDPNSSQTKEDRYEHDRLSLAQWKVIDGSLYVGGNSVVDPNGNAFSNPPHIDMADPTTFHKLLSQGVADFSIQWAYWDTLDDRFYWFPSDDPDGALGSAASHFTLMSEPEKFGMYFNISGDITGWYTVIDDAVFYRKGQSFAKNFFPQALKFTFTLYDSKGVINGGMVFSHIVYLEK